MSFHWIDGYSYLLILIYLYQELDLPRVPQLGRAMTYDVEQYLLYIQPRLYPDFDA